MTAPASSARSPRPTAPRLSRHAHSLARGPGSGSVRLHVRLLVRLLVVVTAAILSAPAFCAAPAGAATRAQGSAGWTAPLPGDPPVLRGFAPPPAPWAAGHRGVDLGAPAGTEVRAAHAGRVIYAGPLAGRGVVSIRFGTLRTTYEPVDPQVDVGVRVRAGEVIGTLQGGSAHCGRGRPCLHWGVLRGGTYLDPLALLGRRHSRLLPVWGVPVGGATPPRGPGPAAPATGAGSLGLRSRGLR